VKNDEKTMKRPGFWPYLGASAAVFCLTAPSFAQAGRVQGGPRFQFTQPGYANARPYTRPVNAQGRPVSDQDHAQDQVYRGEVLPLDVLLRKAQKEGRGEYLGVEPDVSSNLYRFKFMRSDGKVVWVDVDARSGAVRSVKQ